MKGIQATCERIFNRLNKKYNCLLDPKTAFEVGFMNGVNKSQEFIVNDEFHRPESSNKVLLRICIDGETIEYSTGSFVNNKFHIDARLKFNKYFLVTHWKPVIY